MQEKIKTLLAPDGPGLGMYHRFERLVGLALSLTVSVIIIFALYHLIAGVVTLIASGWQAFDYKAFQSVFEKILTVLIALEFNHTLTQVVAGRGNLVQVRTVILIGILVIVRKFVLIEIETTDPLFIMALALAAVSLGGLYWLVRREGPDSEAKNSGNDGES